MSEHTTRHTRHDRRHREVPRCDDCGAALGAGEAIYCDGCWQDIDQAARITAARVGFEMYPNG